MSESEGLSVLASGRTDEEGLAFLQPAEICCAFPPSLGLTISSALGQAYFAN